MTSLKFRLFVKFFAAGIFGACLSTVWHCWNTSREEVWYIDTFTAANLGHVPAGVGDDTARMPSSLLYTGHPLKILPARVEEITEIFSSRNFLYDIIKGKGVFSNYIMVVWAENGLSFNDHTAALYKQRSGQKYELAASFYLYGKNTIQLKSSGEMKILKHEITGEEKGYPSSPNLQRPGRQGTGEVEATDGPSGQLLGGGPQKTGWYALRWKIEMFHKILKSGCQAEESLLRSSARLVSASPFLHR